MRLLVCFLLFLGLCFGQVPLQRDLDVLALHNSVRPGQKLQFDYVIFQVL